MKSKIIAITGGIASGKSTFSAILRDLGQTVYDADKIYSEIILDDSVVRNICKIVGVDPYIDQDGKISLNKERVSEVVFNDKAALSRLNEYTHGLVYDRINEIAEKSCEPLLFFEIPLLFESGRADMFDDVIIIMRDKNERILGAKLRSNMSEEDVLKRMASQIDYDYLDKSLHTVINNDGGLLSLKLKAEKVIEKYTKQKN